MGLTAIDKYIIANYKNQCNNTLAKNIGVNKNIIGGAVRMLRAKGYLMPAGITPTAELVEQLTVMSLDSSQPLIQIMAINKLEDIKKEQHYS
jgi:hypothetical protein